MRKRTPFSPFPTVLLITQSITIKNGSLICCTLVYTCFYDEPLTCFCLVFYSAPEVIIKNSYNSYNFIWNLILSHNYPYSLTVDWVECFLKVNKVNIQTGLPLVYLFNDVPQYENSFCCSLAFPISCLLVPQPLRIRSTTILLSILLTAESRTTQFS